MSGWHISISPQRLADLRGNEAFAESLTLGRVANLLRSAIELGMGAEGQDDITSHRNRSSSVLLLAGILAEALPVLERSGRHFRHLPGFDAAVVPILRDREVARLRNEHLTPVRNQAVFHNDAEVSRAVDTLAPEVPQNLAEGDSDAFMGVNYPLANVAAFVYAINNAGARANPVGHLTFALEKSLDLASRVCHAIDTIVGQFLNELGFVIEDTPT